MTTDQSNQHPCSEWKYTKEYRAALQSTNETTLRLILLEMEDAHRDRQNIIVWELGLLLDYNKYRHGRHYTRLENHESPRRFLVESWNFIEDFVEAYLPCKTDHAWNKRHERFKNILDRYHDFVMSQEGVAGEESDA